MFKMLQKIGKAFMLPIAILPAAGLLLGIGGALSNPTTVATYPVLNNPVLQGVFTIMSAAGTVVFANLAMLLCVGLCIGLAKRDKGTAALAGVVGFLVMNATITSLLGIFNHRRSNLHLRKLNEVAIDEFCDLFKIETNIRNLVICRQTKFMKSTFNFCVCFHNLSVYISEELVNVLL